jgi:hypothetical protein
LLNHCGITGLHPSHRSLLAASFYVGGPYSATIPSIRNASPRTWAVRCSPGYSIVVVKLDAVCDPGEPVGTRQKRTFRFACAYYQGIGTFPKFSILGAMGQIQSIHSSPRLTRLFSKYIGKLTTGRLTKPYPGGFMFSHLPLDAEPAPGSNYNDT